MVQDMRDNHGLKDEELHAFGETLTDEQRAVLSAIHEDSYCAADCEGLWCCVDHILNEKH